MLQVIVSWHNLIKESVWPTVPVILEGDAAECEQSQSHHSLWPEAWAGHASVRSECMVKVGGAASHSDDLSLDFVLGNSTAFSN